MHLYDSIIIHCQPIKRHLEFAADGVLNFVTFTKGQYFIIEPRHDISNNVVSATSKASDQPAHTRSLIRAFASRLNNL